MNVELGKSYLTRDGLHVVRVISLIGSWWKKAPVVGELYELNGKKHVPVDGLFQKYEHWSKTGRYLGDKADSDYDLVKEYECPSSSTKESGSKQTSTT